MSTNTEKPTIKVQDVLALLKKGYTRYTKDDEGYGSIQSYYGLSGVQVKELFQHSKLKARKTILPKESLNIVDEEEEVQDTAVVVEEVVESTLPQNDVTGLEVAAVVVDALLEEKSETEVNKEELFK